MVHVADTPALKQVAAKILLDEVGVQPCGDLQALFWVTDDEIKWVAGYTAFIGKTCQMHMVALNGGYAPRKGLFAAYDYPFNKWGIEKIIGIVNSNNERAYKFDLKIGMKEVLRFPGVHCDGGDMIMLTLDKADCRWIKKELP
jgi:hypothetical protein